MADTLAKKVREVAPADGSGCTGITTYLKNTLQRGRKFHVKHKTRSPAGKAGADVGLKIGRFTDHLFRAVVDGGKKVDPQKFTHRRVARILKNLRAIGIRPIRTQLGVALPE